MVMCSSAGQSWRAGHPLEQQASSGCEGSASDRDKPAAGGGRRAAGVSQLALCAAIELLTGTIHNGTGPVPSVTKNSLPPVNWRWVEEGDGYVGRLQPPGQPLMGVGLPSGLQCLVLYPYRITWAVTHCARGPQYPDSANCSNISVRPMPVGCGCVWCWPWLAAVSLLA
jgi:hypothetical protein